MSVPQEPIRVSTYVSIQKVLINVYAVMVTSKLDCCVKVNTYCFCLHTVPKVELLARIETIPGIANELFIYLYLYGVEP